MARIRKIEIANLVRHPGGDLVQTPGINCLIGPGDGWQIHRTGRDRPMPGARRTSSSRMRTTSAWTSPPQSASLTLGDLDDSMGTLESFWCILRGYHANTGVVEDQPSAGAEVVSA